VHKYSKPPRGGLRKAIWDACETGRVTTIAEAKALATEAGCLPRVGYNYFWGWAQWRIAALGPAEHERLLVVGRQDRLWRVYERNLEALQKKARCLPVAGLTEDDLLQECLLLVARLLEVYGGIDPDSPGFDRLLRRAASNRIHDLQRRSRAYRRYVGELPGCEAGDPVAWVQGATPRPLEIVEERDAQRLLQEATAAVSARVEEDPDVAALWAYLGDPDQVQAEIAASETQRYASPTRNWIARRMGWSERRTRRAQHRLRKHVVAVFGRGHVEHLVGPVCVSGYWSQDVPGSPYWGQRGADVA
jgi:hypothetical protein